MMKPILITSILLAAVFSNSQVNFSVTNHTGSWSITCTHPTISLSAQASAPQIQFSWDGPQGNVSTSSNAVIFAPGNYTVTASGAAMGMTQTFAIGVNTVAPTAMISPTFQNINCNPTSVMLVTLTAQNPSQNISHSIASPMGGTSQFTTSVVQFHPGAPGTYTHCLTDLDNGCRSCKEFTVFSADAFPTFSLQSPQGFTLGCGTKSCANVVIANAQAQPSTNPLSFTFVTQNMTYPATGPLSIAFMKSVCGAETWTAVARDNTTYCESKAVFSVISDTSTPVVSVSVPFQTLSCSTPQTTLTAMSQSPASFNWSFPGPPGNLAGSDLPVNVNFSTPTSTLLSNYSLTATHLHNDCSASTVISMYQNVFPPVASFSGGTINCFNPTITLVNTSFSGIPAGSFPDSASVGVVSWEGPAPQTSLPLSNSYAAYTSGVYTLTVIDNNNGCQKVTTNSVASEIAYPMGTANPPSPDPVCFEGDPIVLAAPITGNQTHVVYGWFQPPGGSTVSVQSPTIIASVPGMYTSSASDTLNGCGSVVSIFVENCVTTSEFSSSPVHIFPNPAHSNITIKGEETISNYLINSSDGKPVLSGKATTETVDISMLPAGMYILRVFDEHSGRISRIKLVKL